MRESRVQERPRHDRRRQKGAKLLGALLTTLVVAWPVGLEVYANLDNLDLLDGPVSCEQQQQKDAPDSFQFAGLYRRVMEWRGLRPATDRVLTVTLDDDVPVVQRNACLGRAFTADLLDTLASLRPAAIALDKYYPPHGCDDFPGGTERLQESVAHLPVPLVIGLADEVAQAKAMKATCLCVAPRLALAGPMVTTGYVRLDEDVLEMPLNWPLRKGQQPGATLVPVEEGYGLAFATALRVAPGLREHFRGMLDEKHAEHPYADLWAAEALENLRASEILCAAADPAMARRWGLPCTGQGRAAPDLRDKVIVIGSANVNDLKLVLGEQIYGYEVHARYIAALLGKAYLREWALLVELALTTLLIVFTQYVTIFYELTDRLILRSPSRSGRRFWSLALDDHGLPVVGWVAIACAVPWFVAACCFYPSWGPSRIRYLPPLGLLAMSFLLLFDTLRLYVAALVKRGRSTKGERL